MVLSRQVQFVVDAVYAMAHAIDDVRKKVCGGRRGICPKLKELDGGLIYQALLNVTFVGEFFTVLSCS